MTIQVYKPRARKRYTRMLATLGTIVIGALGAVAVNARAASADPTVHTLVANTPESWAPHVSDEANTIGPSGTHLTISCYMSGDTVAGPYGPEYHVVLAVHLITTCSPDAIRSITMELRLLGASYTGSVPLPRMRPDAHDDGHRGTTGELEPV